jgi:hypothetical protein
MIKSIMGADPDITPELVAHLLTTAWWIHGNEQNSQLMVNEVLFYFRGEEQKQIDRLRKGVGKRIKSELTRIHLLQKSLFQYSYERYERSQEVEIGNQANQHSRGQVTPLDEADMIVRYLKHLVYLYLDHNSYYAAVGQTSFVYDYPPASLETIYREAACGRYHTDYRQTRDRLLEGRIGLEERFERLLTIERGLHDKKQFAALVSSELYLGLVQATLRQFNLWGIECFLKNQSDYVIDKLLKQFGNVYKDPKVEQQVEANWYHALICVDCLDSLAKRLRLRPPLREKLRLPLFNLNSSGQPQPPRIDRSKPPLWSPETIKGIIRLYNAKVNRRRSASAMWLLILVDGNERARLKLDKDVTVSFVVKKAERLVKVIGQEKDGSETPLVMHSIAYDDELLETGQSEFSVVLEGGQKIGFSMQSKADESVAVEVLYRHPSFARKLLLWREGSPKEGDDSPEVPRSTPTPVPRPWYANPGYAVVILLLCLAMCYGLYRVWQQSVNQIVQKPAQKTTMPADIPATPLPEPSVSPLPSSGSGDQALLENYSPRLRRDVEAAVKAKRVVVAPELRDLVRAKDQTLDVEGVATARDSLRALFPDGIVIRTASPTFRWRPIAGVERYIVKVYDDAEPARRYDPVAESGPIVGTKWTLEKPLPRRRIYTWQVTASDDPGAGARRAQGKFRVLALSEVNELKAAERVRPRSHLAMGVLYARLGLLDEAEGEFRAAIPQSEVAKELLRDLKKRVKSR